MFISWLSCNFTSCWKLKQLVNDWSNRGTEANSAVAFIVEFSDKQHLKSFLKFLLMHLCLCISAFLFVTSSSRTNENQIRACLPHSSLICYQTSLWYIHLITNHQPMIQLDPITTVNLNLCSYESCHDTSVSHTTATIIAHYQKEIGAKVCCIFGGPICRWNRRVISCYHGYFCQYVVWVFLCFYMYVTCVCVSWWIWGPDKSAVNMENIYSSVAMALILTWIAQRLWGFVLNFALITNHVTGTTFYQQNSPSENCSLWCLWIIHSNQCIISVRAH